MTTNHDERDDDLRGAMFRELEKRDDRSPDFKGHVQVAGQRYRVAGWIREGQRGKFVALKLRLPQPPRPDMARDGFEDL